MDYMAELSETKKAISIASNYKKLDGSSYGCISLITEINDEKERSSLEDKFIYLGPVVYIHPESNGKSTILYAWLSKKLNLNIK